MKQDGIERIEAPSQPVLLTGASGKLGRELVRRLGAAGWSLRLTDLVPFPDPLPPGATFTVADLGTEPGAATIAELARGCCAVVHFGGVSVERPFSEIEPANIRGAVAVWEAARAAGPIRVVFASSNHVVGLAPRTEKLNSDCALRPDGQYGLSKAFAELLARLYATKHAVPAVLLRIGSCTEAPTDARMLSTWLGFDDLTTLVARSVLAPTAALLADGRGGCAVVWGASANSRSFWAHDDRECIGWNPRCSADGFAPQLTGKVSGSHIAEQYQGGLFAAMNWTARDEVFDTHVVRPDVPFCFLDCTRAFDGLSEQQKLYAHHLAMASWAGAPICLHQTSPEAPALFSLVQRVFRSRGRELLLRQKDHSGFVEFCANFLGNMGNYLSFGDTKIVPRCTRDEFLRAVEIGGGEELARQTAESGLLDAVIALEPRRVRQLGIGENGISTYYSGDVTEADIAAVQKLLDNLDIHPCNTRLAKLADGSFRVHIASVDCSAKPVVHQLSPEGPTVTIVRGDFSRYLAKVVEHLRAARAVAPNKLEADMLDAYIAHFMTGDVSEHKRSQELWVADKGPAVETNIGFIESYRDPAGVRAEYEGWVAIVDAVGSKQLATLVDNAPSLLPLLPWGAAFEKETFSRPDFTAIDVLAYGSSGVPLGINLPNYNDVRQSCGFKNVALGNSMRASSPGEQLTFLSAEDSALCKTHRSKAAEIQVGLHELLGHGSGRLFIEEAADGTRRFDPTKITNPLTNKPITSWYHAGQTYESVFGELASAMEECRAEAVGLLLSVQPQILHIFGIEGVDANTVHDVSFVNWLLMARNGILALEFFTPITDNKHGGKWRQAHMRARFAILRTLMGAGDGKLVQIEIIGTDNAVVKLDRDRILADGVPAIRSLLTRLQVYRSTADAAAAEADFGQLTAIRETDTFFNVLRGCSLAQRKPRRVFVQAHTVLGEDGKVHLHTFDASPAGMIESFQARYPTDDVIDLSCAI